MKRKHRKPESSKIDITPIVDEIRKLSDLVKNLIIVILRLNGIPQRKTRDIVGVDIHRVYAIYKLVSKERKEKRGR